MNSATNSHRARILLADDHVLVAEACKKLLEPEFEVVAIVGDGRTLLSAAAELQPDLIVIDISMPQLNGLDAGRQIKHTMPGIRLVYLTMNTDREVAVEAFRSGASGYLMKTSAASELAIAVRESLKGGRYVSSMVASTTVPRLLEDNREDAGGTKLTSRQREVLQLLAEGYLMKQAAAILGVSTRTVAFHKYRMMSLLGLTSNAELVQYAIRNSIIPG